MLRLAPHLSFVFHLEVGDSGQPSPSRGCAPVNGVCCDFFYLGATVGTVADGDDGVANHVVGRKLLKGAQMAGVLLMYSTGRRAH